MGIDLSVDYSKPVSMLSDLVYKICTRVGLVKAYPSDGYELVDGGYSSLPGGARAEAERRRCVSSILTCSSIFSPVTFVR